uniref:Uncharacterized protein n=1 Tax=Mycena chlorophos TaxID=658473 RepID=A0ABQ0KVP7_MYCCL|nr:predicted protein [Mycena chlorophos]
MEYFAVDADALARRAAAELEGDSDVDSDKGEENEEDDEEHHPCIEDSKLDASVTLVTCFDPAIADAPPLRDLKRKRSEDLDGCEGQRTELLTHNDLPLSSHSRPNFAGPSDNRQRKRRRLHRKAAREDAQTISGSKIKAFCAKRTNTAARTPVEIDLDSKAAREPVSSTSFVCLNDSTLNGRREKAAKGAAKASAKKKPKDAAQNTPPPPALLPTSGNFTKEELLALGMTEDIWDGISQVVYVDSKGRELAILCGQPRDTLASNWGRDVATAGAVLMEQAASMLSPLDEPASGGNQKKKKKKKRKRNTRRGDHRAETVGVGIGNGRKGPMNFCNDKDDATVLDSLLASEPFKRIAGFCNSIFLNFAPRLHEYYEKSMDALFDWDPRLRRIFKRGTSVFPSCTFNFGPQTITLPHLDLLNLAWGWCFITAFGRFDPSRGGHLILWDLKRLIRFPPGASIAIPSALLRHSNVSIQQGETRYSFTQFAAGGLFRFVESGFQLNESLKEQVARMSQQEREAFIEARAARFSEGLKLYNIHSSA